MFRGCIHFLGSFLSFGLVDVVVSWRWQQHMLHRSLTDGDGGYIWQRLVHSSTRIKGRPSDPRDCLALCLTTGKYKPAYLYGNIMVYSHKAATYHFRAYHLHSVWIEKPITWRVCSDHSGVVHVCQLYDYYWGVLITKGSFWCNIYMLEQG